MHGGEEKCIQRWEDTDLMNIRETEYLKWAGFNCPRKGSSDVISRIWL
jgi:hypothetical protein